MEEFSPLKETFLLGTLNVGLPTFDVYSDIGLIGNLYTSTVTSVDWTYDNDTYTKTKTTTTGHPLYATSLLIPFLINYALGYSAWYYTDMKNPNNDSRRKFTWIFALLGCFPQLVASRIIWNFWKKPKNALRKKRHLERNVMQNEVFTEAVPSSLIMTFLMCVLVLTRTPEETRIVDGDTFGENLFYATLASTVLSACLGLAKCLKVSSS